MSNKRWSRQSESSCHNKNSSHISVAMSWKKINKAKTFTVFRHIEMSHQSSRKCNAFMQREVSSFVFIYFLMFCLLVVVEARGPACRPVQSLSVVTPAAPNNTKNNKIKKKTNIVCKQQTSPADKTRAEDIRPDSAGGLKNCGINGSSGRSPSSRPSFLRELFPALLFTEVNGIA